MLTAPRPAPPGTDRSPTGPRAAGGELPAVGRVLPRQAGSTGTIFAWAAPATPARSASMSLREARPA